MYGVSKINIETSLMMISVQDVEFKGNSLARYLQIFADNGVVVDMISQSAPHGTTIDFSFTASSSDLPQVMKAISVAKSGQGCQGFPADQRGLLQAEPVWRGNGRQLRRGRPCPERACNGGH